MRPTIHDPLRPDTQMVHLAIAHTHLNWLMDSAAHPSGDADSPVAFHFTDKYLPDLLFILVHVMMSIAENEAGGMSDRLMDKLTGAVKLDMDDPRSAELVSLLTRIAKGPSDVFPGMGEPVFPDGQQH